MSTQKIVKDAKRSWRRAVDCLISGFFIFIFSPFIAEIWRMFQPYAGNDHIAAIGVGVRWLGTLLFAAGLVERLVSEIRSLRAELSASQQN